MLFRGQRSMPGVAPGGRIGRPRLLLLLSYDQKPDMVFPESTVRSVIDPDTTKYPGSLPVADS